MYVSNNHSVGGSFSPFLLLLLAYYLLMIPEVGSGRGEWFKFSGWLGGVLKNEPDNEAARNKQTNSQAFRIESRIPVWPAAAAV